nr:hypothetical protein [Rhizobium ruizarguesonis]
MSMIARAGRPEAAIDNASPAAADAGKGRRRSNYPTPELEAVLGKTLGVPVFQESAMRVAMVCAGLCP